MGVKEFYSNPDLADGFGSLAGRRVRPHGGLDFPHAKGVAIPALFSGTVYTKGFSASLGYYITIKCADLYVTYCHGIAASSLAVGRSVSQEDTVLFVGLTGETSGYHLHLITSTGTDYGYYTAGTKDPYPYVKLAVSGNDYGSAKIETELKMYFDLVGNTDVKNPDGSPRDIYITALGGALHVQNSEDLTALRAVKTGQASFRQIKIAEAYLYTLSHGYKTTLIKTVG